MYLKHGETALFATCNFMIRNILPSKMLKIAFLATYRSKFFRLG